MSALTELAEQIEDCKAEITNLVSIVGTMGHRISTLEAELQMDPAAKTPVPLAAVPDATTLPSTAGWNTVP
jgi:hypothetical protein